MMVYLERIVLHLKCYRFKGFNGEWRLLLLSSQSICLLCYSPLCRDTRSDLASQFQKKTYSSFLLKLHCPRVSCLCVKFDFCSIWFHHCQSGQRTSFISYRTHSSFSGFPERQFPQHRMPPTVYYSSIFLSGSHSQFPKASNNEVPRSHGASPIQSPRNKDGFSVLPGHFLSQAFLTLIFTMVRFKEVCL